MRVRESESIKQWSQSINFLQNGFNKTTYPFYSYLPNYFIHIPIQHTKVCFQFPSPPFPHHSLMNCSWVSRYILKGRSNTTITGDTRIKNHAPMRIYLFSIFFPQNPSLWLNIAQIFMKIHTPRAISNRTQLNWSFCQHKSCAYWC